MYFQRTGTSRAGAGLYQGRQGFDRVDLDWRRSRADCHGTPRGKTGYDLFRDAACSRRSRETGRMRTKLYRPPTKNSLPDGEGFIALPITFNTVIARSGATKQSQAHNQVV